jgi:TonB-dependent receptor
MNRITAQLIYAALLACLTLCPTALAQESGSITGIVRSGATSKSLTGVSIHVQETNQTVSTSADGRFLVRNLPAGNYTLIFSYLGLAQQTRSLDLSAGSDLNLKIDLDNLAEIQDILVVGSRGAQASALNQQRVAANIANIVSADDAGRFPDTNAAEALQRVPGISINREEKGGEGRYISIRGLDSGLNNFKLNGINVAQTDSANRRVAMDVFQVDALSTIVVNKTLLPDMDGDGIGGSVELKTASAFDIGKRVLTVTAEGNFNNFAEDLGGKLSAKYATLFGDEDQFGFLISVALDQRDTLGYNNMQDEEYIPIRESDEGEPIDFSDGNDLVPWWFGLGNFDNERENRGASVAFDWRASEQTVLKLKGSYNKLEDTEFSSGFFIIADDDELYQDGVYNPEGGTVYRVRSEYEESVFTNSTLSLSGETLNGNFKFDYGLGYAEGLFDEPNDYEVGFEYQLSDPVLYDYSNPMFPQPILSSADAAAILDPANFTLGGNDIDADVSKDRKYTAHFDVTFEPGGSLVRYWKAGFKLLQSERSLFEANVLDAQGDLVLAGSPFEGGFLDTSKIGSPYGQIISLNEAAVKNWRAIGSDLVQQGILENDYDGELSDEDSYTANEDIYAFYLMAFIERGDWEFIGGARVEQTEFESRGFTLVEDDDGESLRNRKGTSSNTQVLPRVQVNYRAREDLVFRSSVFASLARPEYQFLNAATEIEIVDDNSLEAFIGNPDLNPAYAWNVDLGVEYYLSNIGILSANVFYKNIDDFIFADGAPEGSTTSAELAALYPGFNIDAETVFNGETASVYGLELSHVNQFVNLPGAWSGLGIYANLTLQRSEADTGLEGRDKVDFFNAPEYVGTAALTYQGGGLSANLAYTFRDSSFEELGPYLIDKYQQSYETLDLQLRYEVNSNWEVFFSVIDLLDDDLDPVVYKTLGDRERYVEDITFNGTTYKFGVTAQF